MSELRLILLVAGGLFIAGIAGFEWWRGRRDRGPAAASRQEPAGKEMSAPSARTSLPDINVVREPRVAVTDSHGRSAASGSRSIHGSRPCPASCVIVSIVIPRSLARNQPDQGRGTKGMLRSPRTIGASARIAWANWPSSR